ncbi:hypothetical protein KP509_16G033000 [Ceratopteris richardii]|uniref:Uncharacterized protein n=1 Tax=Ceratopteris richardii TaxID=49495 RepID=A0A8T2T3F4_CERRI|nr:hypothetical protein KP509_16G033000 [Ceratopteris richardii]
MHKSECQETHNRDCQGDPKSRLPRTNDGSHNLTPKLTIANRDTEASHNREEETVKQIVKLKQNRQHRHVVRALYAVYGVEIMHVHLHTPRLHLPIRPRRHPFLHTCQTSIFVVRAFYAVYGVEVAHVHLDTPLLHLPIRPRRHPFLHTCRTSIFPASLSAVARLMYDGIDGSGMRL